ncbi:APC family permease [Cryobacterium psychrophilum]|uniref:Amino acid permease n=1 Tax=Cryobacterium psychrophilum TaxID=41988 RepID=A0A4Y8KUG5_9MICO|nr:amino acid permease [Cryobacterium psychrophilum]TDW29602.1 amino acid/polyamine/organocation transporter (APC superfamily) [Cryobacterium psychrophilum]TFD81732.1 amino acid permease [Cryobacterium psychrophilum]
MSEDASAQKGIGDAEHLKVLGYEDSFRRSMSLWANFALGFTYLSPLVGVYSLFALALSTGGPPSIFWLLIVGTGQLLVALIFGEVVSQYPIAGGIYPWTRRLWGKRYAWMASWVYIWALIVTITAVAEFGSGFLGSLIDAPVTKEVTLGLTVLLLLVAFGFNFSGTKMLGRVARIGLAAELIGVIGVGLYLLIFQRKQEFSVFFDGMGVQGDGSYLAAFLGAALAGLFLFYGFEACGDVAEEVTNPAKRIPTAMIMTILVGGVSALFSFGGYVMAAPDLQAIVNGSIADPIPAILESSLGPVGAKLFLVVAVLAFLSCVLSLQAAASRLLFSFGRDGMIPGHAWISHVSARRAVPVNALIVACSIPLLLSVFIYVGGNSLLTQITSFAVIGIYAAFQAVVLAALRQRIKGWRPAGPFNLGLIGGYVVNIGALVYGIFAMILLAVPGSSGVFLDDWIVLIGFGVVVVSGLLYLFIGKPHSASRQPEGDAIAIAALLRAHPDHADHP